MQKYDGTLIVMLLMKTLDKNLMHKYHIHDAFVAVLFYQHEYGHSFHL